MPGAPKRASVMTLTLPLTTSRSVREVLSMHRAFFTSVQRSGRIPIGSLIRLSAFHVLLFAFPVTGSQFLYWNDFSATAVDRPYAWRSMLLASMS